MNKRTTEMTKVAIDLAKNVLQVACENAAGEVVLQKRLHSREQSWVFLRRLFHARAHRPQGREESK